MRVVNESSGWVHGIVATQHERHLLVVNVEIMVVPSKDGDVAAKRKQRVPVWGSEHCIDKFRASHL